MPVPRHGRAGARASSAGGAHRGRRYPDRRAGTRATRPGWSWRPRPSRRAFVVPERPGPLAFSAPTVKRCTTPATVRLGLAALRWAANPARRASGRRSVLLADALAKRGAPEHGSSRRSRAELSDEPAAGIADRCRRSRGIPAPAPGQVGDADRASASWRSAALRAARAPRHRARRAPRSVRNLQRPMALKLDHRRRVARPRTHLHRRGAAGRPGARPRGARSRPRAPPARPRPRRPDEDRDRPRRGHRRRPPRPHARRPDRAPGRQPRLRELGGADEPVAGRGGDRRGAPAAPRPRRPRRHPEVRADRRARHPRARERPRDRGARGRRRGRQGVPPARSASRSSRT